MKRTTYSKGEPICHYTHLTPFEREKILFFLAEGKSITEIAHLLNRSKSTISCEFRRNAAPTGHGCRLVSVPTIYRAIHAGLLNPPGASAKFVLRKLRHHGKRRHKKGNEEHRGKFVISHLIEDRPASAANRSVRGHWEADTMVGKQGRAYLVTLVDRKSRYLLGGKAIGKTAAAVNKVMCKALSGQPHLSVTPDRGKEFSKHAQLKKELKRVTFYFPAPHHPWERGTNENTNGLLRPFTGVLLEG